MSPEIRVSVALVTRNRPPSLERALRSWRRQSVQPFEIVISDDSDPQWAGAVTELARTYGCRYVTGPRRGLYANRNHAAALCEGSHILSADDDHEHPPEFMALIVDAIERESETVWCIGEFHSWADHEAGAPFHAPGQLSAHGSLWPIPDKPGTRSWAISDGATVYPRGVFDSGLRFYEGVRFGASYCEFGCLLHRLHWNIRPLLTTAVIHHYLEAPRSFDDPVNESAASLFAALMFSFYYQPRVRHQLTSLSKIPAHILRRPRVAGRSLR